MKKSFLILMLACVMVFAFAAPAMAADIPMTHGDMEALVGDITIPADKDVDDALTQEEAVAYVLLWTGMTETQLGIYPADWNSMALSAAIVDIDTFDPTAVCTKAEVEAMMENAAPLYEAMHADKMAPLFIDGVAQPIFPFTTGAVEEGYSNETSDVIRYFVWVETNYDTDDDGKLDLVKALVQVPRAAVEGDYKAATIYEARPYITGCTSGRAPYDNSGEGYDISKMYSQPEARVPSTDKPADTMEHAKNADSKDWYYYNRHEGIYDYEDLEWYDYYLVRGFAVVECGGLGTRDSDGFETCGTDLEIDAFKCVIEWLHGDRVAYTDRENNIPIEADWSNGQVGMTGRSYAGTTQFGLATTGVEGLETIVPVAGIASWYDYTNAQGVSMNSSPAYSDYLAFYCAGRFLDTDDWNSIVGNYSKYLAQIRDDQLALNGDYGEHWASRDYTLNAENIDCTALIVHGLYDYNVRPKHFQMMYDSFAEAGIEAKLMLHMDDHVTPAHPGNKWAFDIDGERYETILNKWFSHYLYDVEDTDILEMADVVVQDDNNPAKWHNYESWTTDDYYFMTVDNVDNDSKSTISSNYSANGFRSYTSFVNGSTACSVMYKEVLDADMTIKGTPSVSFRATTAVEEKAELAATTAEVALPNGVDHDAMMGLLGSMEGATTSADKDFSNIESDADGLKVSAMLVDIAPEGETFPSVTTSEQRISNDSVWLGGGLANYDYVTHRTNNVSYKIITRGWMDLCNPEAGFESSSAGVETKVQLADGKYYDYTIYLQPVVYTLEEGHTLALVIYPHESRSVATNYDITVKDATVYADIPLQATPFEDVESDFWAANDISYVYNRDIMNGTGDMNFTPDGDFTRAMLATTLYRMEGCPAPEAENPFIDVEEDTWYTDAVVWAAANGIVKGTSETTFDPNQKATREQFATMMYRYAQYLEIDVTTDTNILSYEDADQISEYAVAPMTWAIENGLINGMTETLLVPQGDATRAQAAAILARFCRNFF